MIDRNFFADISEKVLAKLPPEFNNAKQGIQHNLEQALKTGLNKLDLVSRQEFDAQRKVLARAQAQIEILEKQLAELEQQLKKS